MVLLSNIPNALINNIGFMAILYLMYECVKWRGNIKPAQLFIFAGAIQVVGLLQFISSILFPTSFSLLVNTAKIATVTIPFNNNIQWLTVIGLIYCFILIYLLARILFQFKYIHSLKKSANFSQSDLLISTLPPHILKNSANIRIGLSNQIDAPITFGWLTPIVLLPIAICNQLTAKEMETILIHEIAHLRIHSLTSYAYVYNLSGKKIKSPYYGMSLQSHGPQFAKVFAEICLPTLGMKKLFSKKQKKHLVQFFHSPKKVHLTPLTKCGNIPVY
jgi:hypothetical protein